MQKSVITVRKSVITVQKICYHSAKICYHSAKICYHSVKICYHSAKICYHSEKICHHSAKNLLSQWENRKSANGILYSVTALCERTKNRRSRRKPTTFAECWRILNSHMRSDVRYRARTLHLRGGRTPLRLIELCTRMGKRPRIFEEYKIKKNLNKKNKLGLPRIFRNVVVWFRGTGQEFTVVVKIFQLRKGGKNVLK